MNQIQIANILLTQRCNLKCDYCDIVKDYNHKPDEYPDMRYYAENELDANGWIKRLDRLKKNNPMVFVIFYGGEPFLYRDLYPIIYYCHENKIMYTIITNNTDGVQDNIMELREKLGEPIRGFTSSVDPVLIHPNATSTDRYKKSSLAYQRLGIIKADGIANDVVAEITVDSETVPYLYDLVKMLSEAGIYSSITMIDPKKSKFYDFSGTIDTTQLVNRSLQLRGEFDKIIEDESLLVHIPSMLNKLFFNLPADMDCKIYKDIHNVTISPDGRLRLCLRIRGVHVPELKFEEVINEDGLISSELNEAMFHDHRNLCLGCNWTCILMSKYYNDQIIDH